MMSLEKVASSSVDNGRTSHVGRNEGMRHELWYRHSGEVDIRDIPVSQQCRFVVRSEEKILADIGDHHITHVFIRKGQTIPLLNRFAPKLTHLRVRGLSGPSQLQGLNLLKQLKVLDLSDNSFSTGLPDTISQLPALNKLLLEDCDLRKLPTTFSALKQLKTLVLNENIFSRGLPEVIGSITSLNELSIEQCMLKALPQWMESLTNLKILRVGDNNFVEGLPAVIKDLNTLTELRLGNCKLDNLPEWFSEMNQLQVLDLRSNKFKHFPSAVYKLTSLHNLDLDRNHDIERIDERIQNLSQLHILNCHSCAKLTYPPYAVCQQGIKAIKQFFCNLETSGSVKFAEVPIATVGKSLSGKTSIMKSMQQGFRVLTFRDETSVKDETTKAFKMGKLNFESFAVNVIDYGGNEIYHLAYTLTQKTLCVPLIVVNLKEFSDLKNEISVEEATRRVLFDWISHLYLACPRLGSPVLALTHIDQLCDEEEVNANRDDLLKTADALREELAKDEGAYLGQSDKPTGSIQRLCDIKTPFFHPTNIFKFGKDDESSDIDPLMSNIKKRCQEFTIYIPRLWNKVEEAVRAHSSAYIDLATVEEKFPNENLKVILRFMHNSGKILWFENHAGLSDYIFHRISAISNMISLLFDHASDKIWRHRLESIESFQYQNQTIGKKRHATMVHEFIQNGMLHEALLGDLLRYAEFPEKISLRLLRSFHIIHGPLVQQLENVYTVPYFTSEFMDSQWQWHSDSKVQLRIELAFGGLSLPKYVYQLITVTVLDSAAGLYTKAHVKQNGAMVFVGESILYLVHDHNSHNVMLQMSTTVEALGESWQRLMKAGESIDRLLQQVWMACRIKVFSYCTHCLLRRDPEPSCYENPHWLCSSGKPDFGKPDLSCGMDSIPCENSRGEISAVPKPLVLPCYELTDEEKIKLKSYIAELSTVRLPTAETISEVQAVPPEDDDPIICTNQLTESADADSDISDNEEVYCPDRDEPNLELDVKPVSQPKIAKLYYNTNKVYRMSDAVRGHVLIFNNFFFGKNYEKVDEYTRLGTGADCENLIKMFESLHFKIARPCHELYNCSVKEMEEAIKQETRRPEHRSYGMFVMVLMSHGREGNMIWDREMEEVPVADLQSLLNTCNFPAMKGKPKLIIVQACSGSTADLGDSSTAGTKPSTTRSSTGPIPASSGRPTTSSSQRQPAVRNLRRGPFQVDGPTNHAVEERTQEELGACSEAHVANPEGIRHFNADDFLVIKSSSEKYSSIKHNINGSWFIRMLVATFYKHACHRDVETLCKIVQERTRRRCIGNHKEVKEFGGTVPSWLSTLTNYRKLYLFPGLPRGMQQPKPKF